MKRYLIITFFCVLLSLGVQSQPNQLDKTWIVGIAGIEMEFNGASYNTTGFTTNNLAGHYGDYSNICDTNGNLEVSTDGFFVYDSNFNVTLNGDSIVGREYI